MLTSAGGNRRLCLPDGHYLVVMFESKAAYVANANSPE